MFAARGVALGLGRGVNLNDLRNLSQQCKLNSNVSANRTRNVCFTPPDEKHVRLQLRKSPLESTCIDDESDEENHRRPMGSSAGATDGADVAATAAGARRKRKSQKKKKARIVVKKSLDKSTFWAVCRAIVFGTLLIALGAAMSTLGYYKDMFAEEMVSNGNSTNKVVNPSIRLQFETLSYIGPCIMGIGAFVLMIACVMTMEGREQNIKIYTPRSVAAAESRVALATAMEQDDRPEGPPDAKMNDESFDANNNNDVNAAAAATDQKGGESNKCYVRDDSKSASTTTTTLTWSRTNGLKCEATNKLDRKNLKYPSTSCIDVLISKTQDGRALLQRFLDDERRLVENRHNHKTTKKRSVSYYFTNQSASLDTPETDKITSTMRRCVKSDEFPTKCNVVAEVHQYLDKEPTTTVVDETTSLTDKKRAPWLESLRAPVATDEIYSPMSITSSDASPSQLVLPNNNNMNVPMSDNVITVNNFSYLINDNFRPYQSPQNLHNGNELTQKSFSNVTLLDQCENIIDA